MIIIKVVNQKVIQLTFTGQASNQLFSSALSTRINKSITKFTRSLVQSTHQNQKVTIANNQQLIPIARNISFRQCNKVESQNRNTRSSAKASFSISASSPSTNYVSASLGESIIIESQERESAFEALKRRAKDAVERREVKSSKYYGQSFNESLTTDSKPKLVVLMSWLEAKEKHIEKYRQFYLERGFDVLNVKTSPFDLLLPNIGAKKISNDFVSFLVEKEYSDVILHGFSVGGYMFGQVLLDIDRQNDKTKAKLLESIRGLVFDSLVPFEGTCVGVANSVTSNQYLAKILEHTLKLYLFLGYSISTKYFLQSSDKVWGGPLRCPSLFLMSKDDKISDHKIVERLIDTWDKLGIETHKVLFDSSPHVQIFQKHRDVYVEKVEKFIEHLKI